MSADATAAEDAKARALAYLRRKGSEAPVDQLAAAFRDALRRFEAAVESLPPDQARRRPPAGGWSVQQVVDHLILSHQPAIAQLEAALRGDDPGPPIPAHITSAAGTHADYRALVAELRGVHDQLIARVETLPEEPPATTLPIAMVLKVEGDGQAELLEWTENLDAKAYVQGLRVHTLEHRRQVERILAAVAA